MAPRFLRKPLTQEEIEERYKEIQEEWIEVNDWVKEESDKLAEDKFSSHQAKSACKRNLVKANRRVGSVRGTVDYWKNRVEGMTHFRASIKLNEYWASQKEKAAAENPKKTKTERPNPLKQKL
ncbi:MAG: hypothetical protein PF542_00570 [Nanoarchaeota archaeon]|jgi:hypothetical protein|nr:hypothetical protein [Nanoarchaeota archaeon]